MKIVTSHGSYEMTTERDYTPTPTELHYWYGGTHAGLDPNNPYAPKRMNVTKTRFKKL